MHAHPKITVVMPVYNCAAYVAEAIDSILGQTYSDFEFIIIDDASTDTTLSIVKSFNDSRIQIVEKPKNTGLTNSLNIGLSLAKGRFIARMDGDDISLPNRFELQVAFMEHHTQTIACGTNYSILNTGEIKSLPLSNEDTKAQLLYKSCFAHPTVMLRKSKLDRHHLAYSPEKEPSEDYDFWVRLMQFGELRNLPEVLLRYREHKCQVSKSRHQIKKRHNLEIKLNALSYIDYNWTDQDIFLLRKLLFREEILSKDEIAKYQVLKRNIVNSNTFYSKEGLLNYFDIIETRMLKDYFLKRTLFNLQTFMDYIKINKIWGFRLPLLVEIKLLVKSIIKYKISL